MPKIVEKDTLSRDTGVRIRRYCFKNLKAFWSRHLTAEMKYHDFVRILNYNEYNKALVDIVEDKARELKIVASGVTSTDDKVAAGVYLQVQVLLNHIDHTLASELSFVNLQKLQKLSLKIRPMVS